MNIPKYPHRWAMLAKTYDAESLTPPFPCMVQPKLDGLRAMWTGEHLVTRERHIWPVAVLPHIYVALRLWSKVNPGISLDGEIYHHGMPFQLLAGFGGVHRTTMAPESANLRFHAFDIVDETRTAEQRQIMLKASNYPHWVPVGLVKNSTEIEPLMQQALTAGYEGIMLRDRDAFYEEGRTVSLLKVKPWYEMTATIVAFQEGEGKYAGTLGALVVIGNGRMFKVSGGISDDLRDKIWHHQKEWMKRSITVAYQDLSLDGKPLKPQTRNL